MNAITIIEAAPVAWKPIEIIPADRKDGRDVLLWVQGSSEDEGCAIVGSAGMDDWWDFTGPLCGVRFWADISDPSAKPIALTTPKKAKHDRRVDDSAKRLASTWKAIENIPSELKDGRMVLLCAGRPMTGQWYPGDWIDGKWINGRWINAAHKTIEPTDWADIEGPGA